MPKNSSDIELSDAELARAVSNRTEADKLKDSLIHMMFVAMNRHPFDVEKCIGCREAKELSGV